MEPVGEPLLIHVRIRVFHFGDIPDGGGTFSVDVMYVNSSYIAFLFICQKSIL